jgi:plasmid stability protein
MPELTLREIEPELVAKLMERAAEHCRSVEEEHRAILRDALLGNEKSMPPLTFEAYLRTMPYVGTDADFARSEGSIRDINLSE